MKKDKHLHFAWLILLGVILIRGFAGGGLNTVSALFLSPVSSELGVGIGSLAIYLSITSVVMVFWLPIAGKLINQYDIRTVTAGAALLQALSFAGFGLMNSVYGWYLLAVPYSMGATILANLLGPILINRWFAKNTGLMLGIQMAFVGLFGAVFQPVTSGLIARSGWRMSYFILGAAVLAAILIPGFFLLRNRPEEKGLLPYGQESGGEQAAHARESSGIQVNIGEREALQSASFYLLLLFMIAITGVAVFSQHIPTYGGILGYSLERTGTALAFASVGSAVGSIAIGVISDRIGALKTCYGVLTVGLVAVAGFLISGGSFHVFGLSAFLHGLTSSGIMVLAPILTLKFYGKTDFEKIYAKVAMGAPLASILLIPAYGFIYDLTGTYTSVLLGMVLLLLLALFSIAVGWRKRCTINGCPKWRE